jgi:hypothetical protein
MKRTRVGRLLQSAAVVVSLLLATSLTAQDRVNPEPPDSLALVGKAAGFARLEVGRHWNGPEAALLKKVCQAHPVILLWGGHGLEKGLGLKYGDLDHILVVVGDFKNLNHAVALFTTRAPFDRDKVFNALVPGGKPGTVKGKEYVADQAGFAVHAVSKSAFLFGNVAGVEAALGQPREAPGELSEALKAAAQKPLLTVALDPRSFAAHVTAAGKDGEAYVPLFRASAWQLTAEAGDDLTLRFGFTFADATAATAAVPAVMAAAAVLDKLLEMSETEFPKFIKRETGQYPDVVNLSEPLLGTISALRAALKDLKPRQEGAVVRADLRIKTNTPATALLMISTLAPRPKK